MEKTAIKRTAAIILQQEGPLNAARWLAQTLFIDKTETDGSPYYGHLERVAAGITDERIKPIGYLHDLVEDIDGWEFEDLEEIGFNRFIMDGVRAVTKDDDDPYFDEMVRVGLTPQAIPAKKSDLRDNSNLLRLPHVPTENNIERARKYYLAWHYLNDVEQGNTAPGTPFANWMRDQPEEKQDWDLLRKYSIKPAPPPSPSMAFRP